MTGILCGAAARAHSATAVIIGTPMPATTRVVQMEPAPMPTFTASTPSAISASVRFGGGDVAGDEIDVLELAPDAPDHVEHALRVAVRGVDDEHVHVRRDERLGARERVLADADRRADAQPAEAVLARVGILHHLLDVLDGDEPLEHVIGRRRPAASRPCGGAGTRAPARASCRPAR